MESVAAEGKQSYSRGVTLATDCQPCDGFFWCVFLLITSGRGGCGLEGSVTGECVY